MTEYTPKAVNVDFDTKSGVITLESVKDSDEFIRKYNEFILYKVPKFLVTYREVENLTPQNMNPQNMTPQNFNPQTMNPQMNPQLYNQAFNSMMMGFNNMNISNKD
jgi:hypothetical protein